jgi:CRISPR-associated protein Cas2
MPCYVACFDIADDRTRDRVAKRLLGVGDRVQKSVFEIRVDSLQALAALAADLRGLLDTEDDLRFYRICLDCRKASCDARGAAIATFPATVIV